MEAKQMKKDEKAKNFAAVRERELYFREVKSSLICQCKKNHINFEKGLIAFIKENIKDRLCYVKST